VPSRASSFVRTERLWDRHVAMARLGATAKGGVCRLALSKEEIPARRLLTQWGRALGCTVASDPIGNLFLTRAGTEPSALPVLSGSHLDSQPTGGRFDGIYGVLAALEAVEAMNAAGLRTPRPIEVVAWTNEEGCRFVPGCMGSLAFRSPERLATLLRAKDPVGLSVAEALAQVRAAEPDIPERPLGKRVAAFVEAHIEQGPLLEANGQVVGIVTGIQGTRRFEITVEGEDAHAGTTPLPARRDALSSAVSMVAALERLFQAGPSDIVRFTVGRFDVWPNAPSVVPGRVFFTIDFRSPDDDLLTRLGDQVASVCDANRKQCAVEIVETIRTPSIAFSGPVPEAIEAACRDLQVPYARIYSGAGHDAQHLFHITPTGMIFVPCEKGISHNERENAKPQDLADGARVLADVLVTLANS
jgi:beta-ureidopropionase / N-carbamoyl-L-amino-acid hydrolase